MKIVQWLATLGVLVLAATSANANEETADLAIRNATVVSAERAKPLAHTDVLIKEGRILAVTPAAAHAKAAHEIDATGLFLTPGLIDGHVHLYHATGLNRRYTKDFDALYAEEQRQQPRSYLYFGYTSVVELNAQFDANDRFQAVPEHPDLYSCGQGLVLSNDFMATDYDSEAEFLAAYPNFLHDRFTTPNLPAGFDPAEHTPAVTVARIAKEGGRCVKLYYEEALWWPGKQKPDFKLPSEQIVREVVAAAHARGMIVLLHGTTPEAHRFALATGIDVIAHGIWDWDGAANGRIEIPPAVLAAVDDDAAAGVYVEPTYRTVAGTYSLFDPHALDDRRLGKVLPADYLAYLHNGAQQGRAKYLKIFGAANAARYAKGQSASANVADVVKAYILRYRKILARMQARGTHFLFGTDTATGGNGWGNPPGLNGYWEMQAWAQAGIPLETIFRAATFDNARAFHLDGEVGTVAPGKRANLLLLRKNPLKTLSAYDSIAQVILHGKPIPRSSLAADARPTPTEHQDR